MVAAVTLLLLIGFGGTASAYFGDEDSTLAGSTFDLRLDRSATASGINAGGVLPGMSGQGAYSLQNAGSLTGDLAVSIPAVINTAGAIGEFADGRGDLGAALEAAPFIDTDGDGAWSVGDIGLGGDDTTYRGEAMQYSPMDTFSGAQWEEVIRMQPGSNLTLVFPWRLPETAGNQIQGDSISFQIVFTLSRDW